MGTGEGDADSGQQRRSLVVAALGTIIEWYDFGLYIYLAPIYARIFFPSDSQIESLIATFGVFAVAYMARPLGAIVFGRYGDRSGRRQALVLSAAIIAVSLLVNGLIPSEAAIGVAAPIILLLTRLTSGFAIGAEYSGILSYLLETGGRRHRGLVTSLAPAMSGVGTVLAVAISSVLTASLSVENLDEWGWRIPVLFGALLAASMLLLRRKLEETPHFRRLQESGEIAEHPVREALTTARRAVLYAFIVAAVGSVAWYLNISYVPTYLTSVADVGHDDALRWATIAGLVVLVVAPLAGWASDRVGRKGLLLLLTLGLAATTAPLFALLAAGSDVGALGGAVMLAIPAAAFSAVSASAIPEQLPSRVRFTGLALGYNIAVALFGGLTPLMATLLFDWTGAEVAPAFLVVVAAIASLGFLAASRETAWSELDDSGP